MTAHTVSTASSRTDARTGARTDAGIGAGDAAGSAATSNRSALRRTLWALQIFIAAFLFFASALPKFAGQKDAVETFTKMGWDQSLRYLVGFVEAAGAIGLVIPRLAGVASIGLIGLMIGAIFTQIFVLVPAWALLPAAYAVVFALVAYDRRADTRQLFRSLLRR